MGRLLFNTQTPDFIRHHCNSTKDPNYLNVIMKKFTENNTSNRVQLSDCHPYNLNPPAHP